ncbi:uncharacterized protein [Drosophila bipectinata]|uniref:uncharacterized protein n=1 Tax=Drosophila bipectinata TaxID=42026 RepID=UPI001C896E58|nr:uncharacterized protein LOC108124376 [Drosophila bipectinata]
MRYLWLITVAALSLANAAPPKTQNEIIAQFFGYVETIRDIQFENMLTVTLHFVSQIVESVPAGERGPATASLQAYVDRGQIVKERGTRTQKLDYCQGLQELFGTVGAQMQSNSAEGQVIGMSVLGLLGVASEFAEEDTKFYNKFSQGATQMKEKLTPSTISRESELFQAIDEYINSKDFQAHEALIEKVLSFKNRY